VTDYSSSSEESESSDEEEEDGESETHDGTVAVSDIPRLIPTGAPGSTEQYNVGMVGTHGLETSHTDTFSSSISREGTLMIRETSGEKKRSGHSDSNGFAGHINLPDLVQQSRSPAGTPTEGLGRVSTHSQEMESGTEYGMGSSTKASFTPFVDPRVYQTSPTDEDEEDEESSAAGKQEGLDVLVTAWFSFLIRPDKEINYWSSSFFFNFGAPGILSFLKIKFF